MKFTRDPEAERYVQKELTEFDDNTDQDFEQTNEDIFNHRERLQSLENGKIPQNDTILSLVFQEIKKASDRTRKKSSKGHSISLFKVKSRLSVFVYKILDTLPRSRDSIIGMHSNTNTRIAQPIFSVLTNSLNSAREIL